MTRKLDKCIYMYQLYDFIYILFIILCKYIIKDKKKITKPREKKVYSVLYVLRDCHTKPIAMSMSAGTHGK